MSDVEIVGFDHDAEASEILDRSLLAVEGPLRVSFGLRFQVECPACEAWVPFNGLVTSVRCACGEEVTLFEGWWDHLVTSSELLADAFCRPPGDFDYEQTVADNERWHRWGGRREPPHCHGCGAVLPEELLEEAAIRCPACEAPVPGRPADARARALCPGALAVIGETPDRADEVREFYLVAEIDGVTRWSWILSDSERLEAGEIDLAEIDAPVAALERLAGNEDVEIREQVARREGLPDPLLERLAGDEEAHGRAAAAENPRLPAELLEQLAGDDAYMVQLAVAKHPRTPIAELRRLAALDHIAIREAVAENPATPRSLLAELMHRGSSSVAEIAARRQEPQIRACPLCDGEGPAGEAACPTCGVQQILAPTEGEDLMLVRLRAEVKGRGDQGRHELALAGGATVLMQINDDPPGEGELLEVLGEVSLAFDARVGGERQAARQVPVVRARAVATGPGAASTIDRAIEELGGGESVPKPPRLRIVRDDGDDGGWRLRIYRQRYETNKRVVLGLVVAWLAGLGLAAYFLWPVMILLGMTGLITLTWLMGLNEQVLTLDRRRLEVRPRPLYLGKFIEYTTEEVQQVYCDSKEELWVVRYGEASGALLKWEGSNPRELFFVKRAVETVLGIPDRPRYGEERPFDVNARLELPRDLPRL